MNKEMRKLIDNAEVVKGLGISESSIEIVNFDRFTQENCEKKVYRYKDSLFRKSFYKWLKFEIPLSQEQISLKIRQIEQEMAKIRQDFKQLVDLCFEQNKKIQEFILSMEKATSLPSAICLTETQNKKIERT